MTPELAQRLADFDRRLTALEERERSRMAEHDRLEDAFQKAMHYPTNYGVPGNTCAICGKWNKGLSFGGICHRCRESPPGFPSIKSS